MYERKIPEDLDCGIILTMKVLGGKWQPCIIDAIDRGIRRPSEMHRYLTTASARVINMQLKELEQYGIIYKKIYNGIPLKVEYYLTALGESILPVITAIDKWGLANREQIKSRILSIEEEQPAIVE
ncbi:transcriptional regulator [Paraflavitalea soli]|uniref:Transcriptional regulator n=1 Tax=Paraflavitalea soli TaxID=2315862 RepID=A0A3B7MK82_9BACT|nr:helix-turn-helix domain-containing protein [Paraflavitalea soli]AXY74864.1 transcriptional regulator [Paraflavitalea soli]